MFVFTNHPKPKLYSVSYCFHHAVWSELTRLAPEDKFSFFKFFKFFLLSGQSEPATASRTCLILPLACYCRAICGPPQFIAPVSPCMVRHTHTQCMHMLQGMHIYFTQRTPSYTQHYICYICSGSVYNTAVGVYNTAVRQR